MSKITMIKEDAIADIKISSGFLQMLQRTMMFIATDKTTEELDEFKKAVEAFEKDKQEFPEDWMDALFTLTVLIREIENNLINTGQTYEKDLDEEPTTQQES
jgi:hypothetical protein